MNGVLAIKRDCTVFEKDFKFCIVVKKDFNPSRALVVGGNGVGESSWDFGIGGGGGGGSSPNVDRGFSDVGDGGGRSSLNVNRGTGGFGARREGGFSLFVTSWFKGYNDGFRVISPIVENVSHPRETPYTNEVPSCKLCYEMIDLLAARIDALEKTIITMISERGIRPLSNISDTYTPDVVKKRKD